MYMHVHVTHVCVRGQRTTRGATSQALGSGVVHERSARAGIRPVARGSGDPLVCGRRAQQLTFIHSEHITDLVVSFHTHMVLNVRC